MKIQQPCDQPYKRRRKRRIVTNWEHDRRLAHLAWTTKGVHVYYTYRSCVAPNRLFHQQFANVREYSEWWAAFHNLVKIRKETWPRQWTRTAAYNPDTVAPGAKPT